MAENNDLPTKLLWIDLEMTGLNPTTQRIIEVAALVTDFEFNQLDKYEAVIHQPDSILDAAEQWPRENMQDLFDQVRDSQVGEEQVIAELAELIQRNFGDEPAVLAGNSIHQDRLFIRQWWAPVEKKLHYRMLDVSTLKIWIQGSQGEAFAKQEKHRALEDIEESIDELKWALGKLRD